MKKYIEIINEDIYNDDKKFRKAYDSFHDAISNLSKEIKRHNMSSKAMRKFNTAWEDIEQTLNTLD